MMSVISGHENETMLYIQHIYRARELPLLCMCVVCKVLFFVYTLYLKYCYFKVIILSDDDFEIKSKIYSLNCLSCFIHILNYKMSLFFGICFF